MNSLTTVRGGEHFSNFFDIFYMLNMCSKNRVFTHIFKLLFVQWEKHFCGKFESWTYYLFHGKKFIFFETFIRQFYGQSFIKTVRGPLKACMHFVCNCIRFKEYVLNHFQNLRNGVKGTFQDIFSPIVDKPLGYKPGVVGLTLGFSSLSITVIA